MLPLARAVPASYSYCRPLGNISIMQVTVERLESMLYTAPSPPVDLMIRTSGEKRLSDFLLWQSENAVIHFTSVLWPEFSLWHLLAAIFYYQVWPE